MARLARFTLDYDKRSGQWLLRREGAKKAVRRFSRKADAMAGGVLSRAVKTGSVKIKKKNGWFQEERTYPRGADPRRSKG